MREDNLRERVCKLGYIHSFEVFDPTGFSLPRAQSKRRRSSANASVSTKGVGLSFMVEQTARSSIHARGVETPPTQTTMTITASHTSVLPAPLKTDRDLLPVERIPRIVNFPNLGLMSFVLMICTISPGLTGHCNSDVRLGHRLCRLV